MEHLPLAPAEEDRDGRLAVPRRHLPGGDEDLHAGGIQDADGVGRPLEPPLRLVVPVEDAAQEAVVRVEDLDAHHVVGGRPVVVGEQPREGRLDDVAQGPVGGEEAAAAPHEGLDDQEARPGELAGAVDDQQLLGPQPQRGDLLGLHERVGQPERVEHALDVVVGAAHHDHVLLLDGREGRLVPRPAGPDTLARMRIAYFCTTHRGRSRG